MFVTILSAAAVALASYFLGCVNGAIIASRVFYHDDVRKHGSGNAGLTNYYRTYGPKTIWCVLLIDMLKALIAVLIGGSVFGLVLKAETLGKFFAALFCIVGHMFPVFYKFEGGKGILSSGMVLLMLDWRIAVVGWGLFLLMVLLTRYVSLGSVAAALSFPITTWVCYGAMPGVMICAVIMAALVLWAHRSNIKRLLQGRENKFRLHPETKS